MQLWLVPWQTTGTLLLMVRLPCLGIVSASTLEVTNRL